MLSAQSPEPRSTPSYIRGGSSSFALPSRTPRSACPPPSAPLPALSYAFISTLRGRRPTQSMSLTTILPASGLAVSPDTETNAAAMRCGSALPRPSSLVRNHNDTTPSPYKVYLYPLVGFPLYTAPEHLIMVVLGGAWGGLDQIEMNPPAPLSYLRFVLNTSARSARLYLMGLRQASNQHSVGPLAR